MLEDQDYQEIAHIFKVILESDIGPKINRLAEGQQLLLETLAPKTAWKSWRMRSLFRSPSSACTASRSRS